MTYWWNRAVDPATIPNLVREVARRAGKPLIGVFVSLAVFAYLGMTYDLSGVGRYLAATSPFTLATAFILLLFTVNAGSFRFAQVVHDFGAKIGWLAAFRASVYSTISGLLFFQFVGQTLTRAVLLERLGVPGSSVMVMALYERGVTMAILILAALAGVFFLFEGISFEMQHSEYYLGRLFITLLIVFGSVGFFVFRREIALGLSRAGEWMIALKFSRVVAITAVTHFTTILSYAVIAQSLEPSIPFGSLFAAGAIISFIASLPISFAGWGVRELSAVFVFSSLQIDPEKALAISVSVGLLSTVALLSVAGATKIIAGSRARAKPVALADDIQDGLHRIGDQLNVLIPTLVGILVLFQFRIPIGETEINVNLADPIVMIGVFMFVYGVYFSKRLSISWFVPELPWIVLLCSTVLVFSYVNGIVSFGWSYWAFFNRFLGWFLLLAYGITGALMAIYLRSYQSQSSRPTHLGTIRALAKVLLVSSSVIVISELLLGVSRDLGIGIAYTELDYFFRGFSTNPNAFAFALAVVVSLGIATFGASAKLQSRSDLWWTAVVGICVGGMWLSGSRTAQGMIAMIWLVVIATRQVSIRTQIVVAASAIAVCTVFYQAPTVVTVTANGVTAIAQHQGAESSAMSSSRRRGAST